MARFCLKSGLLRVRGGQTPRGNAEKPAVPPKKDSRITHRLSFYRWMMLWHPPGKPCPYVSSVNGTGITMFRLKMPSRTVTDMVPPYFSAISFMDRSPSPW